MSTLPGVIYLAAHALPVTPVTAELVIGAFHRLYQIEASFRMSKHDLVARPIYHHKCEFIDAHFTSGSPHSGRGAGRATHRLVDPSVRAHRTALPHFQIRAGQQLITAADPLPVDLNDALTKIHRTGGAH